MNELIILCEIVVVFSVLLICKKLFGKIGVMVWVSLATVLANIITAKNVNIFGLSTAIGTVMFASTFLATDILAECYSPEDAKKAIRIGLFSNVILIVSTQIALLYTPSEFDYADDAMKTLFSLNLRISIASAVMYYIANMADIYVFGKIKQKTDGRMLWLRNNVATILCNCLENFGFIGLAFAGIYDFQTIMTIALSTSVIEALVAVCDTPFLYVAKKISTISKTGEVL
jgi:uncharacterized integral membrane protein (TIGR00697 family)